MEEEWINLLDEMEQFLFDDMTESLNANRTDEVFPYLLNTEKVVTILKKLKRIEQEQKGFNEAQLLKLNYLKNNLLDLDNKGKSIYWEIQRIYNNIEEY